MKTIITRSMLVLAALGITGCASMEAAYKPESIGLNSVAQEVNGLRITIRPEADAAVFGKKLPFKLMAHNVSGQAMYLPRDPNLLFCWIYPTGRRDNYVMDMDSERFYQTADLIRVEPGQAVRYAKVIDTYYFPKRGITEFYAVFQAPRNTNPNIAGVWSGKAESNRYGVLVDKASRIASYFADNSDQRVSLAANVTDI